MPPGFESDRYGHGLDLGRAEATILFDVLQDCAACRTRHAFLALLPKLGALLSFDHALALAGRLDRDVAATTDCVVAGFPEGWLRDYAASELPGRDALVARGFAGRGPCQWSDAGAGLEEPNALALCRDHGLRRGHVAGHGPLLGSSCSLFCFTGTRGREDRRTAALLRFLTPHLHLAFQLALAVSEPPPGGDVGLTRREREVLGWLKEGKSSWAIGMLLGISERTANFHAANIMRKLGVANRAQAVAAAIARGIIDAG